MDKSKAAYDEFTLGESCPPTSPIEEDGTEQCDVGVHSPATKVRSVGDLRSGSRFASLEGVSGDDEGLKALVVPDSEDERKESPIHRRSGRRRLRFTDDNSGKCVSDTLSNVTPLVDVNDEYYANKTEFEKIMGLFFPAFSALTPKRRKQCFPRCIKCGRSSCSCLI